MQPPKEKKNKVLTVKQVRADRELYSLVREYAGMWIAVEDWGWHSLNGGYRRFWGNPTVKKSKKDLFHAVNVYHPNIHLFRVPYNWETAEAELVRGINDATWMKAPPPKCRIRGLEDATITTFDTRTPEQRRIPLPGMNK